LILAKASNVALALCQNKELLSQLQLLQEMEKIKYWHFDQWFKKQDFGTINNSDLLTVIKSYLESKGK
jgi:hypothetical protein